MAYNSNNLTVGRGKFNCIASSNSPAYHAYETTDTLDDVLVSGYFSDNFNFPEGELKQGDLLWVVTSTDKSLFWLSAVTPVPILSENLTPPNVVAEEDFDGVLDLTGPWAVLAGVNYTAIKQGSKISITITGVSAPHIGNSMITGVLELPDGWAWPSEAVYQAVNVTNNSINAPGFCSLGTFGNIEIGTYQASGFFTAGDVGFTTFTFSYDVPA